MDSTQGVEAQTLANVYQALDTNHEIIPVLNKVDLPASDLDRTKKQIEDVIGIDTENAIPCSGKTGEGIEDILFKHKVQENVILNACETKKIQWLYENQLVRSSELCEDNIKLELIWDGDNKRRFKENFVEQVL